MGIGRVLVVEDDPSIRDIVVSYLQSAGYETKAVADGASGLYALVDFEPDVVVLDVMLPGMDGIEVLSRIRRHSDAYVIILSARTEEIDRLEGLAAGADDYVTKPFSPRELVARIRVALRRLHEQRITNKSAVFYLPHFTIDAAARTVRVDDSPITFTTTEFDLLWALAENRGRVMTRSQLIRIVWGDDYYGDERIVDVNIGNIRRKLATRHGITTVRGVGYRLEAEG